MTEDVKTEEPAPAETPAAEIENAELTAERDQLIAENEQLKAALKVAGETLEALTAKPAGASKGAKPAKARTIGPVEDQPSREDLLSLIGAASTVEVAFSDGKREILGLAPLLIQGEAWRLMPNGVKLNLPELLVYGPGHGGSAFNLNGYGLILDGKLVAYASRGGQLQIGLNAKVNLADDVIF